MSYYLKSGNTFRVATKESMDLHEALPADNYVIKQDMQGNLYLETINRFEIKGKIYGETNRNRDRILNTFLDRSASTGVMLSGEKGSGKSLLAKAICAKGVEENIPCIVINAPWSGDKFNAFLQTIDKPTIILFDEFEKVYDSDEQENILTLLDGVFPSKKLFIFTCNDKWRVDVNMRNRPGRIYYMIDFKGLDRAFIEEYCTDNLKNKNYIERVCGIGGLFNEFNFDMLKALVEEMNRYNESPDQSLKMLNAKPEFDATKNIYSVNLAINGVSIEKEDLYEDTWAGNPFNDEVIIEYYEAVPVDDENTNEGIPSTPQNVKRTKHLVEAMFTPLHVKKVDTRNSSYFFVNEKGETLTLTRQKTKTYDFLSTF